jgi:hypothetical protein
MRGCRCRDTTPFRFSLEMSFRSTDLINDAGSIPRSKEAERYNKTGLCAVSRKWPEGDGLSRRKYLRHVMRPQHSLRTSLLIESI